MPTTTYTLIAGANVAPQNVLINTDQPLYGVIEALVRDLELPTTGTDDAPIVYGLFVEQSGSRQRLGRDVRLTQIAYAPGTTLYLAPAYAPWWEAPVLRADPPPIAPTVQRSRNIPAPLLASGIIGIGVLALVLLLLFFPRGHVTIAQDTEQPVLSTNSRIVGPVPTFTLVPPPPTFTPLPTPTPAIIVQKVEPEQLITIQEPILITVTGRFAGELQAALIPEDTNRPTITLDTRIEAPDQAILSLGAPVAPINGSTLYQLVINERPVAQIMLQDFLRSVQVQGILSAYINRGEQLFRREGSVTSAFLWNEAALKSKVQVDDNVIMIHNNDPLDILNDSEPGVYQVRIQNSTPPLVGWLPRWLVDNQDVPPEPVKPLVFGGGVFEQPSDGNVACGERFESKIWVLVKDKAGHGIQGAVVRITSVDGRNSYTNETNDQGGFTRGGLGCTTWRVELISVPKAPKGIRANSVAVELNGGLYSGAGIQFRQQ